MSPTKNIPEKDAVAIIGMSCRFPNVHTLDDFWELLKDGKDTVAEISKERWNSDDLYDPDPLAERKTNQKHASLLSDIHDFDPLFFNISPAESIEMSPSQKLMLELAWESIENSSVPFNEIKGKKVGVFVGNIWNDFEHFRKVKNARATLHSAVGMSVNVIANRVSFAMGFTGPSLVVDTGCSASLVALHLAFQSLLNNESDMTMVAGINHIMDPGKYVELTRFGGLSVTGKCSTFDADADGFVRGEGGGVLLLKRLSEAERDGNKILAVIRGTAVNNNGFNDTLPATSTEGQKSLLQQAYQAAGIEPHQVHYVEAHGTGTKLGDPNEARAIGEFFSEKREGKPLRVGSVKTNVGHTEATAGIAGIIKVVLAMQHKKLPPNLNFNKPNPNIPFHELKMEVQTGLTAWPINNSETFKAGVNSFGWGGTNAHAVLEQYIPLKQSMHNAPAASGYCLTLSAKSSQALLDYAKKYADRLATCDEQTFMDICIATSRCKPEFDHRTAFTGVDRLEVLNEILNFIKEESEVQPVRESAPGDKVVFVFPGQGAQWLGMGCELFKTEPVFKHAIEECDRAFRPYTDWSLIDQLHASPELSRLAEINVVQPAICAMQIALAKLWMSWGLVPHAVIGHSMGEVAAAYISGALSIQDAAKVICTRSSLMKTVSGNGGAMLVSELTQEKAVEVVDKYNGKLSLAVNNSPKSTVLAGDKAAIDEVILELESKGLFCRLIKVDVASHSPQMDPLMEPLRQALNGLLPAPSDISFYSTVQGKSLPGNELTADYWVKNLRGTVQFASTVQKLIEDKHTVFLEANPHPVLVNAVSECADANRTKITTIFSTLREKPEQKEMLKNLGDLFIKGYSFNWGKFYKTDDIPHVVLPSYPFQREKYEIEDLSAGLESLRGVPARFPLLGQKINLAHNQDTYYWESAITVEKFPYLKDHQVHDKMQVPLACYIEIALEAVSEVAGNDQSIRLERLSLTKQIFILENERLDIQTKLVWAPDCPGLFQLFTKETSTGKWIELAKGVVRMGMTSVDIRKAFEEIEYQENSYTEGIQYYNLLRSIGFNYGKHFHQLTGLDQIGNNAFNTILYSIKPEHEVNITSGKYRIHPALISSFFQPILGELTAFLEKGDYLQVELDEIMELQVEGEVDYNREIRGMMMVNSLRKSQTEGLWDFEVDILVANSNNDPVLSVKGLKGRAQKTMPVLSEGGTVSSSFSFESTLANLNSEEEKLEAIQQIIVHHVSKIIKSSPNRIKATMTFKGMGVDSLMAVQLRNLLEKDFKIKLPVSLFWAHPSIQEYAVNLKMIMAESMESLNNGEGVPADWFSIPKPKPNAAFRLFCFHDAGGSAALFDGWEALLNEADIEFVNVEMPGRGRRIDEPAYTKIELMMKDIVPALRPLLDRPYIFLGHSMGGMVAFEIIRELRRINLPLPETLFISSTSGLNAYEKDQVDYNLGNDELVSMYPHLDLSKIGDEELQALLIKILRADLQFLYNYDYYSEAPLNLPIVAIHGNNDERVKRNQIEQWEHETSSSFELLSRSGGHRYIEHDAHFVTQLIVQKIKNQEMVS